MEISMIGKLRYRGRYSKTLCVDKLRKTADNLRTHSIWSET